MTAKIATPPAFATVDPTTHTYRLLAICMLCP